MRTPSTIAAPENPTATQPPHSSRFRRVPARPTMTNETTKSSGTRNAHPNSALSETVTYPLLTV
jgi:hypothetical protein